MQSHHRRSAPRRILAGSAVVLLLGLAVLAAAGFAEAAPKHPYNEGCKALAAGDVAAATKLFAEAVKLDPKDTDALNNLGVCYLESGDYDKALPLFQKVLRLNRRYRGADLNIGAGYLFQNEPAKAEPPTERAQDTPATANGTRVKAAALYNLALIDAQAGRLAKAQAGLEKSADIAASSRTDVALAAVLSAQGEHDEGIALLTRVAEADPEPDLATTVSADLAAAYYQRGMARLEAGEVAKASADFAASNEQAKNDYAAMGLALVEAERGRHDAAVTVLTRLADNADSPQLAKAAARNLARVQEMPGGVAGTWLEWVVLYGGGVLFALQAYVVMIALTGRRRGAGVSPVAVLGAVAGVATAAVFALVFFDVVSSPVLVLAALAADVVIVALTWWGAPAGRRRARTT